MSDQPLADATAWFTQSALMSLIQPMAILAVSILGIAMLRGHFPVRRGGMAIIGCFIMIGAVSIAASLLSGTNSGASTRLPEPIGLKTDSPPPRTKPGPTPSNDPYAGASLTQ